MIYEWSTKNESQSYFEFLTTSVINVIHGSQMSKENFRVNLSEHMVLMYLMWKIRLRNNGKLCSQSGVNKSEKKRRCWTDANREIFTIKKIFIQRTSRKNICDFSGFQLKDKLERSENSFYVGRDRQSRLFGFSAWSFFIPPRQNLRFYFS